MLLYDFVLDTYTQLCTYIISLVAAEVLLGQNFHCAWLFDCVQKHSINTNVFLAVNSDNTIKIFNEIIYFVLSYIGIIYR